MAASLLDVRDYGAVCNGVTDDTTAIQAAINAAEGGAGMGIKLFNSSVISSSLNITSSLAVKGDGRDIVTLKPSNSAQSAINFNPSSPNQTLRLAGFSIIYPSVASSGAAALFIGNISYNTAGCFIEEIGIYNATTGLYLLNAINPTIKDCIVQNYWLDGFRINSPLSPDAGGGLIKGNQINNNGTSSPASNSITWNSGGGILFSDNKLFTANIGFNIDMTDQTTEVQFVNNLVVNMQTAGASVQGSAGLNLVELLFNANIFDSCNYALYVPSHSGGGQWLNGLVFNNNAISAPYDSSLNQITLYDTFGFIISNNSFKANGGSPRAIFTDSSSDTGVVGPNVKSGPWIADFIASTNTTVIPP